MQYRIPKMTGGRGKGLLMNDACGQATIFVALVATCDPPSLPCRGFLWGVKSRSPNRNAAGLVLVVAPSRVFFGGGFLLRALPPRAFLLAPRVRVRFRPTHGAERAELDGEALENAHAGRLAPMVFASSGTALKADAAKLPATWEREAHAPMSPVA